MKLLKIKGIEKLFKIVSGEVYNINIENINYYHKFINALFDSDEEFFVLSKNYSVINFMKEALVISDPYSLNPNSKKILTALYKKISNKYLTSKIEEDIIVANNKMIDIINELSLVLNMETDFNAEINIIDILSLYNFSFKENPDDYLNKILTYIKANLEISNLSLIISLNLLPLFNDNELVLLKKELELLGICLLNVNIINKLSINQIDQTTIDIDLCEF